ncbi:hypothetical protein CF319_g3365 [Tilletia indica]|nr:hypothetical protein CF319_g3365 [Tilletia indica]
MSEASSVVNTAADQIGATASVSNPPEAAPSAKQLIYSLTVLDVKYWGLKRTANDLAFTILRHRKNDLINATRLLQGVDLGGIDRDGLIRSGPHTPINERRDTDVLGTWVTLDRARELTKKFNLEAQIGGILLDREILQVQAVPAEVIEKNRRPDVVGSASRAAPYHVRTERASSSTTAAGPSTEPQARQSLPSGLPLSALSAAPQKRASLPVVSQASKAPAVPAPGPSSGTQVGTSEPSPSKLSKGSAAYDELPGYKKAILDAHFSMSAVLSGSETKYLGPPTSKQKMALESTAQMMSEFWVTSETAGPVGMLEAMSHFQTSKDRMADFHRTIKSALTLLRMVYPAPAKASSVGDAAPRGPVPQTQAQLESVRLCSVSCNLARALAPYKFGSSAGAQPKPATGTVSSAWPQPAPATSSSAGSHPKPATGSSAGAQPKPATVSSARPQPVPATSSSAGSHSKPATGSSAGAHQATSMTEASSTAADQLGATASISNPPAADPSAKHSIYSLTILDVKYWGLRCSADGLLFTTLRRCEDDLINATKLLRGVDLGGIDRDRLIRSGPHTPINERRDTDVLGTWVTLDRARELAKRFKLEAQVGGILLDREILLVQAVPAEDLKKRRPDVVRYIPRPAPYHIRFGLALSSTTAAGSSTKPQARQSWPSGLPSSISSAASQARASLPAVSPASKTHAVPASGPSLGTQVGTSETSASTLSTFPAAHSEVHPAWNAIYSAHTFVSAAYSGSGTKVAPPTSGQKGALIAAARMIYDSVLSSRTASSKDKVAGTSKPVGLEDCPEAVLKAMTRAHTLISAAYPAPATNSSAENSAPREPGVPTTAQLRTLKIATRFIIHFIIGPQMGSVAEVQPKPAPSSSSSSALPPSSSVPSALPASAPSALPASAPSALPASAPSSLPAIDPTSWSVKKVTKFGRSKGWSEDKVLCHLRQHKLSGSSMMSLRRDAFSLEVLSQIGIVDINDKLMILAAVEALRNNPSE